jgi:hypothetical protein
LFRRRVEAYLNYRASKAHLRHISDISTVIFYDTSVVQGVLSADPKKSLSEVMKEGRMHEMALEEFLNSSSTSSSSSKEVNESVPDNGNGSSSSSSQPNQTQNPNDGLKGQMREFLSKSFIANEELQRFEKLWNDSAQLCSDLSGKLTPHLYSLCLFGSYFPCLCLIFF